MKAVYNAEYGGFGLSERACELLAERAPELFEGGKLADRGLSRHRHHPALVSVVEELGQDAVDNERYCRLRICEIPDGLETFFERGHIWGCCEWG